eukprot:comp6867_c0_seq1/m.2615 comp6867_c0_seq1/g.2615  ORF comp6867_c0_seq1/g.2615 comp6867_c0_seq1/m.2615 type:complete len:211 (-) comp6867_c0_seq1:364-996(-)
MAPTSSDRRYIICGAPASGKGTQCEKIVEATNVVHISTGDLLRAEVKAATELGAQAKSFMDKGALVPDEVIIGMVKNRLAEDDCRQRGWLLDGFPRTAAQAQAMQEAGIIPNKVILLNVPDECLVERVCGRRMDPVTGVIYHMKFKPAPTEEIASRLTQRSDDTEEAIRPRIATYHRNLAAILDYYTDRLVQIDGNRKPSDVTKDVIAAL